MSPDSIEGWAGRITSVAPKRSMPAPGIQCHLLSSPWGYTPTRRTSAFLDLYSSPPWISAFFAVSATERTAEEEQAPVDLGIIALDQSWSTLPRT